MKVGEFKFILNKEKFIIAKVVIYDITDTHVRIQNIINNDICPAILPIPLHKSDMLFDCYQDAKASFGAFLFKHYQHITEASIIESQNFNINLDVKLVRDYIAYTQKYYPELLI